MTYICRMIPSLNLRLSFKTLAKTMSTDPRRLTIAVCQITSKSDKEENFICCSNLIRKAAEGNAKVVFLPEACDYLGRSTKEILALAEPLDGPTIRRYKVLAKLHKVWLSLGGIHEKDSDKMVSNSHVIINEDGVIAGVYRKVHLFDVEIPEKKLSLKESKYVNKGLEIVPPVQTPVGNIGMGIVVDPWGKILAECTTDEVGIILADLDMKKLATVRRNMPVVSHLREDLYASPGPFYTVPITSGIQYQFGLITLQESVIFLKTFLTIAFVNKKCVLPGHVLVAPIRQVKKLEGLTEEEAADFFKVIRMVEKGMEKVYNTSSSTVSIQNGEHAGQTVFQVHAHIIPRKLNDLEENDEIYKRLEGHESNLDIKRRTDEEMAEEATQLRNHFSQQPKEVVEG